MKIEEIEIGGTYYTKISGSRVKVIVVRRIEATSFLGRTRSTRFEVKRADNGKRLDKARTAAALHAARRPGLLAEMRAAAPIEEEEETCSDVGCHGECRTAAHTDFAEE